MGPVLIPMQWKLWAFLTLSVTCQEPAAVCPPVEVKPVVFAETYRLSDECWREAEVHAQGPALPFRARTAHLDVALDVTYVCLAAPVTRPGE